MNENQKELIENEVRDFNYQNHGKYVTISTKNTYMVWKEMSENE